MSGTVFDSLGKRVLAYATVQMLGDVATDSGSAVSRFATADERGAYLIEGIPPGTYTVGFFHPMLDSLGIDLPLRRLEVRQGRNRVDLAIPSHVGLITLVCGRSALSDTTAAVVGFVRRIDEATSVAAASVLLQWSDLVVRRGVIGSEDQQIVTPTRADGWYAFCNVPIGWMMQLRAACGADTTGGIPAALVARQVLQQDLFVGPTTRVIAPPSDSVGADSLAGLPGRVWSGPATLRGTVRRVDGRPIGGAKASVGGTAAVATTNESGVFVLEHLPAGSQSLDVRAIGFVPEHHVLVLDPRERSNSAEITMTDLRAYLDTIRVTASRIYSTDPTGFISRQRAGVGHFIDRATIEKQNPFYPSDLVRMTPRVDVAQAAAGYFGRFIYMKYLGHVCRPTLYVDGFFYKPDEAQLDDLVAPDQIEGMEIYTSQSQAPVQFTNTMSGCGSIVVWTRRAPRANQKKK
jgi:hypothetical protein